MTVIKLEDVKNHNQPEVKELLKRFNNRHEMNIVEVSEVIFKLITTLEVDHDSGRPKIYTISGGHLGEILGIGKGVVSQYLTVWNLPEESKNFLRNYNLSLINAYKAAIEGNREGKNEAERIKFHKEKILEKYTVPTGTESGRKKDILVHSINEAEMVLNGIVLSNKIPPEILKKMPIRNLDNSENLKEMANTCIHNINQCINYLYPRIQTLPFLGEEIVFCNKMIEHNQNKFCGMEVTKDCLNKQIEFISKEITLIEAEQKFPHISSLIMQKNNLEKNT